MAVVKKHRLLRFFLKFIFSILMTLIIIVSIALIASRVIYDKRVMPKTNVSYNDAVSILINSRRQKYLKNVNEIEKDNKYIATLFNDAAKSLAVNPNIGEEEAEEIIKILSSKVGVNLLKTKLEDILSRSEVNFNKYKVQDEPSVLVNSKELTSFTSLYISNLSEQKEILKDLKVIAVEDIFSEQKEEIKIKLQIRANVKNIVQKNLKNIKIPNFLFSILPNYSDIILYVYPYNLDRVEFSMNDFENNKKLNDNFNILLLNIKNFNSKIDLKNLVKENIIKVKDLMQKNSIKISFIEEGIQVNTLEPLVNILLKDKDDIKKKEFIDSFLFFAKTEDVENQESYKNNQEILKNIDEKLNKLFMQNKKQDKILSNLAQDNSIEKIKDNIKISKYINNITLENTKLDKREIKEIFFSLIKSIKIESLEKFNNLINIVNIETSYINQTPSISLTLNINPKEQIKKALEQVKLSENLKTFIMNYVSELVKAVDLEIKIDFNKGNRFNKVSDSYISNIELKTKKVEFDSLINNINSMVSVFSDKKININQDDIKNILKTSLDEILDKILVKSNLTKNNDLITFSDKKIELISSLKIIKNIIAKNQEITDEEFLEILKAIYKEDEDHEIATSEEDYKLFKKDFENKYYLKNGVLEDVTARDFFSKVKDIFSNDFSPIDFERFKLSNYKDEENLKIDNKVLAYLLKEKIDEKIDKTKISTKILRIDIEDDKILLKIKVLPIINSSESIFKNNMPNIVLNIEILRTGKIKVNINNLTNTQLDKLDKILKSFSKFSIIEEKTKIENNLKIDFISKDFKYENNSIVIDTFSSLIVNKISEKAEEKAVPFTKEEKDMLKASLRRVSSYDENIEDDPSLVLLKEPIKQKANEYVDFLQEIRMNKRTMDTGTVINIQMLTKMPVSQGLPKEIFLENNQVFIKKNQSTKEIRINKLTKEETKVVFKVISLYKESEEQETLEEVINKII